jgi:Domain of unknown function (DUF4292)
MRVFIVTFLLVSVLATGLTGVSCKSTRKIQTAMGRKDSTIVVKPAEPGVNEDSIRMVSDARSRFAAHKIDYSSFSAKIKVDYEDSKEKLPDFTAFIRMKKDSVIWIRIEALLGIEVFRVLIRPDSVFVLDKLKKTSISRSLDYLQELAQIPFDFATVQELLVGNPIYWTDSVTAYTRNENGTSLLCTGELFKHLVTLNNNDFTMMHSKLDDVDQNRSRTCDLAYTGYEEKNGVKFSTGRKIIFSEKNRVEIQLDFRQFAFNEMLKYPFSIPGNYKRQ